MAEEKANGSASWEDITSLCKDAAAELTNETPMIFTPSFSLFESMSAVEVINHLITSPVVLLISFVVCSMVGHYCIAIKYAWDRFMLHI